MQTYIKAGHGYYVGQDFNRTKDDTPIDVHSIERGYAYGHINGDPKSPLGFMRAERIRVRTPQNCIVVR